MDTPKKMWRVGSTIIDIDEDGKFFAAIDGKIVRRASLSALKSLINQSARGLPVLVPNVNFRVAHIQQDEIVRVVGRGRLKGKEATESYRSYRGVYLFDQQAFESLEAILQEYNKLEKEWNAILETLTRVTAKNLGTLQEEWHQDT